MKPQKILITGGTGLTGRYLCKVLVKKGYEISVLSSSTEKLKAKNVFYWNYLNNEIDEKAIEGVDTIIHLAGAGVADKRWTKSRKKVIADSRIKTIDLLFNAAQKNNVHFKTFITASAVGYYGTKTSDKVFTEKDKASADFLGTVCENWEKATEKFKDLETRTVAIRTGIVLASNGGVLSKMTPLFKLGLGSAIGTGNQYQPWIHIEDLCNIYLESIENENIKGAFNAVATEHVTNKTFSAALAQTLNKPFIIPKTPAVILRLLFGGMAEILLHGSRVSNQKIKNAGFKFQFPELKPALINLLK